MKKTALLAVLFSLISLTFACGDTIHIIEEAKKPEGTWKGVTGLYWLGIKNIIDQCDTKLYYANGMPLAKGVKITDPIYTLMDVWPQNEEETKARIKFDIFTLNEMPIEGDKFYTKFQSKAWWALTIEMKFYHDVEKNVDMVRFLATIESFRDIDKLKYDCKYVYEGGGAKLIDYPPAPKIKEEALWKYHD